MERRRAGLLPRRRGPFAAPARHARSLFIAQGLRAAAGVVAQGVPLAAVMAGLGRGVRQGRGSGSEPVFVPVVLPPRRQPPRPTAWPWPTCGRVAGPRPGPQVDVGAALAGLADAASRAAARWDGHAAVASDPRRPPAEAIEGLPPTARRRPPWRRPSSRLEGSAPSRRWSGRWPRPTGSASMRRRRQRPPECRPLGEVGRAHAACRGAARRPRASSGCRDWSCAMRRVEIESSAAVAAAWRAPTAASGSLPGRLPGELVEAESRSASGPASSRREPSRCAAPARGASRTPCPVAGGVRRLRPRPRAAGGHGRSRCAPWSRGAAPRAARALAAAVESAPVEVSPLGWRLRARLHWDARGSSSGFWATASHRVVDISPCRVLGPGLSAAHRGVAAVLAGARCPDGELEWLEDLDGTQAVASWLGPGRVPRGPVAGLDGWHRLNAGGWTRVGGWGATSVRMELPVPLEVPIGAFFQGNRHLVPRLFDRVVGAGPRAAARAGRGPLRRRRLPRRGRPPRRGRGPDGRREPCPGGRRGRPQSAGRPRRRGHGRELPGRARSGGRLPRPRGPAACGSVTGSHARGSRPGIPRPWSCCRATRRREGATSRL